MLIMYSLKTVSVSVEAAGVAGLETDEDVHIVDFTLAFLTGPSLGMLLKC